MRKLIIVVTSVVVLAGAAVALAGQAATNPNGDFVDLNVAISPPIAGTAKAPQGVGIAFDSFTGNRVNGNTVSNNTGITVRFNRGFTDNSLLFPACKINTKGLSSCPKGTQIGTGVGEVSLAGKNGAPPTFIAAKLVAYNGKPFSGKNPTVIFIALLNGKPTAELDFTIKQQPTGPYGLAFSEIIFPSTGSGPVFGITKFSLNVPDKTTKRRVGGKLQTVHLITAPTTCNGTWKFEQTNTFSGGEPTLNATDSEPCVKR
jgi:hypothetical protein